LVYPLGSVIPLYYQIKQTIKGWVIQKEYPAGAKIPSVNELSEKFKVNRLTVRQAISQLIQEGFLTSRRGEGTFVTGDETLINRFSFEFSGFIDDLLHQVTEVKTKAVSLKRIAASNFIRQMLELKPTEKEVIQIKRVRLLKNSLFNYTINYLPVEVGSFIKEKDLYEKRLLQILEKDLSIQFTDAVQTIEATFADSEVAEHLGIHSGSPVLFVQRTMFGQKHKPIELYQSFFRGDLYKFIVRFKNVKSKNGRKWIHQD
jgi:GntR family transcriptional regulator